MRYLWTSRRFAVLLGLLAYSGVSGHAQKSSGPASGTPATTSRSAPTNNSSTFPNATTTIPNDNSVAYQSAIASDNRYVSPYNQLALLAAQEGKWQDAADYSRKVLGLNPVEFVSAYWYNAVSNYHLQHVDEAQKSALELLTLDTDHRYPQVENVVGNIFLLKGNAAEAASHLRAYLVLSPKAEDAASVRQTIDRLDASTRASAK
jgi:tetratricopeptide (TPR) repeat protein